MESDEGYSAFPQQGGISSWTHVKISGAREWHTAQPAPDSSVTAPRRRDAAEVEAEREAEASSLGSARSSASVEALGSPGGNERNLFRMTDELANKTFAFAPAGETPPASPLASRGFKDRSASDSYGGDMKSGPPSAPGLYRHASVSSSGVFAESSPIPGILRRRLAREMKHGLSPAEFAVRREGKLLLVMVGLPARGKTYIAHSIKRHMDWFGLRTEIFNAGNYRRKLSQGKHAPASLFNPMNEEGAKLRQECAEMALQDALDSLASEEKGIYIAIFDATNTTRQRRAWIREKVEQHEGHVKLVCVETVLTDDQKVWENVKDAKLKSPDYQGMTAEEAMEDFFKRIAAYKSVYEPCQQEEGVPFIRLTNAGEEVLGFKTQGFLCARVMQLMDSLRLSLKPILLTRCGESEFEAQGRIGGDSRLTPVGHLYAEALAQGILQGRKRYGILPVVWTSTRLRARQTVNGLQSAVSDANEEHLESCHQDSFDRDGHVRGTSRRRSRNGRPISGDLDVLEVAALDEIDAGSLEGMYHEDFAKYYPEQYQRRVVDKLNVKFPDGENYRDVFSRLEPLLLELVAEPQPVVIVAHLAVLRVIYGYLKGFAPAECPKLKIPMHCVLQLNPKGYGYEEWRHYPLMNSGEDEEERARRATD